MSSDLNHDYSFEPLWKSGIPGAIETAIREVIAEGTLESSVWQSQIRTQLALTLALQQKFDEAHRCLDEAEFYAAPASRTKDSALDDVPSPLPATVTHARIALERGRVFHQAGDLANARTYFEQAQELGQKCSATFYVVDALHMLAIAAESRDEKLNWNEQALALAETNSDERTRRWLGSLWNNKGQWLFELGNFRDSFLAYEKTLAYRMEENYLPNIRFAQWTLARGHRVLGQHSEALDILRALDRTYREMRKSEDYDFPEPLFAMFHGIVLEELALNYESLSRSHAAEGLELLKSAPVIEQHEPQRLFELRKIVQANS